MQQLLELPDIGGSEMFIRGVEHFQHDSSVTFNGHTQCLTGFTQVILKPQPQRVVMRVGTLEQNGADRPQFIDTTVAEIPRYKTLDVMDGMKLLRKHQKKQERGEILVFPPLWDGVLRQARRQCPASEENLPSTLLFVRNCGHNPGNAI
ncbi:hypothetical protein NXV60_14695 [Bacteroides fragilis]|nr:hypothetical protein [Bacteroides thetaiotaomicron]MCS3353512.1 hypothetical protein [Bacteroides thetaiotaomicron]UVS41728.1 hypothetical protein NXV60_14695 [Bacteroides fragilis]